MADKRLLWLVIEFGIRTNVRPIFEWLDGHDAKECGEGVAVVSTSSTRRQIEEELKKLVDGSTRLYVIGWDEDRMKVQGHFINGGRKAAPWKGFVEDDADTIDE